MPLDITGIRHSTTPNFVIENSFFDIKPPSSYGPYEITCNIFHTNVLRHRYTSCYGPTFQHIGKVMDERTWLNLHKLSLAERAKAFPGFQGSLPTMREAFCLHTKEINKPKRWDYSDDKFRSLYEHSLVQHELGESDRMLSASRTARRFGF
ncbi:hypothetical protein LTS18_012016 [Coniosporium uncinatum]|uniref:Uncharacterized protein n=1 Tax=Coniosporium uncinatum TaxID=93489 RepID=A0ACC3DW25_9PEZI|nr:hypothetical protein LTS18_012016 [Coniosporium uncinatum]